MIANPTKSKRFQWYMVLAALTCVSASTSTVEPKTIVANSSARKHSFGVADQSGARVKRNLRTNLHTTESISENEDRVGFIPESTKVLESSVVAPAIDQEAATFEESLAGLHEAAVTTGVSAEDHVPAAKLDRLPEASVIPGASDKDLVPVEKVTESAEKVVSTTSVQQNTQNTIDQHFKQLMGDQIEYYRNRGDLFKSEKYTKWSESVDEAYKKNLVAAAGVKVSTLLNIYGTNDVINMLAAGKEDSETKAIVHMLEKGLFTKWAADDKHVGDVIRLLTLDKKKEEIVNSPLMHIWINYATKMGKKPLELLSNQIPMYYNDEMVIELRHSISLDDKSRGIATGMAQHQLEHWKNNKISVTDSFNLLKLNEVDLTELLRSPVLSTWIDYVKMLGPDPYELLLLAMRKRVNDRKLDLILAAAKTDGTDESIWQILLEKHQVEKWWTAQKTPDDVYDLLKLKEKGDMVFESPEFKSWALYVKKLNSISSRDDDVELAHQLFRHYDSDVVEMLSQSRERAIAKNDEVTNAFVINMRNAFKEIDGKSLEQKELDLTELLRSPVLSTWIDYVKMLEVDPYELLLLAMRKHVGDTKLNSILAAAKTDGTNESIWRILLHMQEKHHFLERLKREYPQVEEWWTTQKTPDDVFNLLQLQEKGEEMFGTDDWNAWVAYLTFLEKQKHIEDQTEIAAVIFSMLKKRFPDDDLAKLIAKAKTVEVTKDYAAEWERSVWYKAGLTSEQVFDLLKLKEKGDMVFESPEFKFWALYVKKLSSIRRRDDDVELAHQLFRHYGPDVVEMLSQSKERAIAKNDEVTNAFVINMRNAFKEIDGKSLEQKELDLTELLRSPVLSTWIGYVKMLGPDPYELLLLAMRKHVGDTKLNSILAAAKTDGTDDIIWRILLHKQAKHQVEEWWTAQKTPDDVYDLLKLKEKRDMVFESPEFKFWALYVKKLSSTRRRNGDVELAHQLFRHYGPDVVEMLSQSRERAIAKNDEVTNAFVINMRNAFKEIDGKSLEQKELDLTELLRSPVLSTWIGYVKMLGPDPYELLLLAMRKHVGDTKLNSILAAAKTDGTDDIIWRILLHKQAKHLVEEWWTAQKTPDDVYDLLKLKEKRDMVFESPEFKFWALYVKKANSFRSRDDGLELAHQLFIHYGPDVVEMLSQSKERAIAENDKVTKEIVSPMLDFFKRMEELGKRLRTSPPALANDSSKRRKILDESKPPTGN